MTIVAETPAAQAGTGHRLPVTGNQDTELHEVYAESAQGVVLVIVDDNTGPLGLGEKCILLHTTAGPMLVIVDEDEFFFEPDPRNEHAPPVTGEPY
jgi:hypothetical protein